jgi:hypothetical protein
MELAIVAGPEVVAAQPWQRQKSSRVWAISIVVAAHAALLFLLHLERSRMLPAAAADDWLTVILVPVPIARPPPSQLRVEQPQTPPGQRPAVQPRAETASGPTTAGAPSTPTVDWHAEVGRVAREAAASASKDQLNLPCKAPRKFGDPPQTDCRPQPKPFKWDPEPGLFGIAGGLPFARVGKRCAIGLGFFACGIGALPKPNGQLFESMDDPDRPRSSVPDSNPGQ